MKVLFEWLKDFVAIDATPRQLAEPLTLAGPAVETIEAAENGAGTLLELEITTNRPDLLNHYGLAREVAALTGKPLKTIKPAPKEIAEPAADAAQIEIAEPELCHRFVGLVLRGVKVQPSPAWLRKRLEACGVASINNIVDVSNYVMLELGHPNHTYDLDTLAEKKIIVRRAQPGEKLITLDGVTRTLKPNHLVIADARRAIGLAGIMGGAETEISSQTKNVLLEAAWFDPLSVRRTAKELSLRTEASYRFERGMDAEAPLWAARRCAELFLELAGGELLAGAIDVYPQPWQAPVLQLRASEIERILGSPVPDNEVERILSALGFKGARADSGTWQVVVPSWRRDVSRAIDVIEEIARLYGYHKFAPRLPPARQPIVVRAHAAAEKALREALEAEGYDEAISFSPVNPQEAEKFLPPGTELARIANPLSEEASALRPSGLLSLVKALAWNLNRGQRNLRLYEIGRTYTARDRQFHERRVLTLAGSGPLHEKSAHQAAQPYDFFALKGAVEAALAPFALDAPQFEACESALFHPSKRAAVLAGKQRLGTLGRLSQALAADFKLRQDAWLAELDLEALYAAGLRTRRYQPLSRFPAVSRDFSLLLSERVTFGAVRDTIESLRLPELVSVSVVDRFRGRQLPAGHYSLLLRVVFQSAQQTLTDEQTRACSERILKALEEKLGATLRA